MSQENPLKVSNSILEKLRCFICKDYLSCSPVRSLPCGNCICGRCSPANAETPTHRLVVFESLLSQLSLPCIFKKHGCVEMLMYGKTADHECKCLYKFFACPMNNFINCVWEGTALQLVDHFNNKHPDTLKNNVEFKLEVDKDAQGILMATENSFTFIVKYFYTANEKILKYDARLCVNENGFEVFYNVKLMNDIDSECNMNLKMSKCCLYDGSFLEMQNAKVLNLNKFLECLGEPDCIVVALNLKVGKSNAGNVIPEGRQEINSDLIKSLRCYECKAYLIPPLFHLDDKVVCCDCAGDDSSYKPLDDNKDLVKRVNEAMYPCYWRDCTVSSNSKNFKDHNMNCQFRLYKCVYSDCDDIFKLSAAMNHLQGHKNAVCVIDEVTYKTSFAHSYGRTDIITIKNNRIILIQHRMLDSGPLCTHQIDILPSPGDYDKVTGSVVLEHTHCKLKSKEFIVDTSNYLHITFEELPTCFKKEDEMSVTVELIA